MEIIEIYGEEKRRYMPLLLLADESEEMLGRYLGRGRMFVLLSGGGAAAECVVTDEGGGVLEIKNLAVAPEAQGRGYGRAMLEFVSRRFAGRFHTLLAGTGESPLTVPFYEKCGCSVKEYSPECSKRTDGINLMKTKHCLRDYAGICLKKNPDKKQLYLKDSYGVLYPLQFDCKNCIMYINSPEKN